MSSHFKDIATVILCGGKNSRFGGENKALLDYNGEKTFIEKIIDECEGNIYVSISSKENNEINFASSKNINFIEDIYKGIGPIGGMHSAFKKLKNKYIRFVSVDTTSITREFLEYMEREMDKYHEAFIPIYNGDKYFLLGIYSCKIKKYIEKNIRIKKYSIKDIVKNIKVKYVDLKYTIFNLNNINTKEEYSAFKKSMPRYFGVCGIKNSGKTTLICKIIKAFKDMGKTTAVIKHTSHEHSFDTKGKDTYAFKESGAKATLIYSKSKFMLVKDYEKKDIFDFLNELKEYDVIILEGFKHLNIPKIEILRKSISTEPSCHKESIKAVVTDDENYKSSLPVFSINNISSIVEFIINNLIVT